MKKILTISLFLYLSINPIWAQTQQAKHDEVVFLHTRLGDMVILLFDQTSLHKQNFIKLAKQGFYDGTTFHRIINGFMIQGGDPLSKDSLPQNDGTGGPSYTIPNEINKNLKHTFGKVAAARMPDSMNPRKESSGSQFYIVQNHNGTSHLDNNYTVFGEVVKGLDVIDIISNQPKDNRDRPFEDIVITLKIKKMKKKKIIKKFGVKQFYNISQ